MTRVYLSPPHVGERELELVREALDSNWVAPLGPSLDAFERELAAHAGVEHAAALNSGTAALHLALMLLDVAAGDDVLCASMTFCASANPIVYLGARPVFIDCDPDTWTISPALVREELEESARRGRLPRAVVTVDLYGQPCDYHALHAVCDVHGVPIIEDAAEALGARYHDRAAGGFGRCGVFSFNGNKMITTSAGGMLVAADPVLIDRARFLASQARDPAPHYQHSTIGYNYRMSNVLAAIGRAQLESLDSRVEARRANFHAYVAGLDDLPGVRFMPEAPGARASRWLTCLTIDPEAFGATREDVRLALEAADIESRPLWKPLHLQPSFAGARIRGGGVAARLFATGLCLPSGSSLTPMDRERVIEIVRSCAR